MYIIAYAKATDWYKSHDLYINHGWERYGEKLAATGQYERVYACTVTGRIVRTFTGER